MNRRSAGIRVIRVSLLWNVALGLAKVSIGWWGNSRALMVDGLHSLSDLATDLAVLFGFTYSERPSDTRHHYGYHKVSSMISLVIALAILVFCLMLVYGSVRALGEARFAVPHWPTLVVALVSLVAKEWLFRYTNNASRKLKSRLLLTNAWHHRTDSVSSAVVAVGILAVLVGGEGFAFLDTLIGVVLGVFLAVEGIRLLSQSLADLMDRAPESRILDDLREHVLQTRGVVSYHAFRARKVGDMIDIDLHILVDPWIRVTEGHEIAKAVKRNILARHPEVLNVLVHIEPNLPGHKKEEGIYEYREE